MPAPPAILMSPPDPEISSPVEKRTSRKSMSASRIRMPSALKSSSFRPTDPKLPEVRWRRNGNPPSDTDGLLDSFSDRWRAVAACDSATALTAKSAATSSTASTARPIRSFRIGLGDSPRRPAEPSGPGAYLT